MFVCRCYIGCMDCVSAYVLGDFSLSFIAYPPPSNSFAGARGDGLDEVYMGVVFGHGLGCGERP